MRIQPGRRINRIALLIALLTLISASAPAQQKTSDAERELFNAVNQERKAHGLPSLKLDQALTNAARLHAERMAEQGTISHQLSGEPNLLTRARADGAHFSWISENVDEGSNAKAIHQSFIKSPRHQGNMLDSDMDSIGVGIAERNGQLYAVEDFSKAK
jgi:uncharacterized protein YkwD